MKRKVLVTGAAGKTASCVAEDLTQEGFEVRALVRGHDDRSTRLANLGAEVVTGDMLAFSDMETAVRGMDSAYFCYPTSDRILEATTIFAAAAAAEGLKFAVNMSQIIARHNAPSPTSRLHWLAERVLDQSSVNVTHVKPTFFADHFVLNTRHTIAEDNRIFRPYGKAHHAPIVSSDIARVVSRILIDPIPHFEKSYVLTGIDRVSFPEIAEIFSDILGRRIEYIDVPIEKFETDMRERGFAKSLIEHHLQSSKDYREGRFDTTNNLVGELTGQPAMRFRDYIKKNIDAFASTFDRGADIR